MKWVIFVVLTLVFVACTPSNDRAFGAIRDMGFTDINLEGHDVLGWGCPENANDQNTTFTATQPANGRRVRGIVCCDYWGACSVRTRN